MYLLRIAFRNLFRRRGRTFVVAGILAFAVVFFLFMESLMMGMMDMTFGNVIDFETPHIEIAKQEFLEADNEDALTGDRVFVPDRQMLDSVRGSDGYLAMTTVLDFPGVFFGGGYDYPVQVRGIDADSFSSVFKNEEYLVEGDFVAAGQLGVVIGDQLAELLDLGLGDDYELRFFDQTGSALTLQGTIRGIVAIPHPEMSRNTVLVCRQRATEAWGFDSDTATQVMVRLDDRDKAVSQAAYLGEQLDNGEFTVRSYRDAASFLVSLETWGMIETYFILALFLLVGAIGIVSAVVLAAIERVREIGMMKAMGLKEGEIVRVFLWESAGIGAIGGAIGCALGAAAVLAFKTYGIDFAAFFDLGALGVPMAGHVYGAWNTASFVWIFLFVVVLAVVASIIPAYWAARKDPVDAIQHR